MKKRNKILLSLLAIIVLVILASFIAVKAMEANLNLLVQEVIAEVDLSTANDGVFIGNHKVLPVDVEVQVTVKNHVITEVLLVKHFNGQGTAAEVIPDQVVDAQSLQVDAIAGATYSSKIILKAIQSALLKAGATLVNP
jgi:uncharacterized protein with FMN-binding domain